MIFEVARREAAQLLRNHWDGTLPVRLTEMTAALGAHKYEEDLGPVLSGMVTKKQHDAPRIALNSTQSAARRRFTWAHELGHIVERRAIANDPEYSFTDARGLEYDLHEFFADEFAGALLIPEDELRRYQQLGYTNGQLARTFGVSLHALSKRLERLSLQPSITTHA